MSRPVPAPADLVGLLRPRQWIKNAFIFIGLIFGHAWGDPHQVAQVCTLFAGFCLLASGVYALNDVFDREADRAHPVKRSRPVASGRISRRFALTLALALSAAGFALACLVSQAAAGLFACYLLLNIGYSAGLKHVAVLDVFMISAGFMLRILAGTLGIGIEPSHWLLLCGLLVTLFLGFAKRRAELFAHGDNGNSAAPEESNAPGQASSRTGATASRQRQSLAGYSLELLDQMIAISAGGSVIGYALYTVDASTLALHGTDKLIYTLPLVLYGVFRYLLLLYRRGGGSDPVSDLLRDPHLLAACAGWVALTWWLLALAA